MERQTKIVCTIGPATDSPDMIRRLMEAGMNVARLNFSHGTHEERARDIKIIRETAAELNLPIAILQDLSGPKIRTGMMASDSPAMLVNGSDFALVEEEIPGDENRVSVAYFDVLAEKLKPGDSLFMADGTMQLKFVERDRKELKCQVVVGGELRSRQGINVPGVSLGIPAVTEKDLDDLAFGMENEVDFVALSFVQRATDLILLKHTMRIKGIRIPIIAKIEKHEALENIDAIIDEADGIMIARGDLGIEIPLEQVPVMQKMIINKAGIKGKPVITATQMLESMVENSRPTRAEVTDVANAIFDGTDAVMLSGETAIGKYPIEAVKMMAKIACSTEEALPYEEILNQRRAAISDSLPDAISHAACYIAQDVDAKAIICCTQSGYTARMVAKYRPRPMVIAVTPLKTTYRSLALSWDVLSLKINYTENTDEMMENAKEVAKEAGLVDSGDTVIITAGVPIGVPGKTNTIKADVI